MVSRWNFDWDEVESLQNLFCFHCCMLDTGHLLETHEKTGAISQCLHYILCIWWQMYTSDIDILKQSTSIESLVLQRWLWWSCHVVRMMDNRILWQWSVKTLPQKKVITTVWWLASGIIHYNLNPGETIMLRSIARKSTKYTKKLLFTTNTGQQNGPILLHDNLWSRLVKDSLEIGWNELLYLTQLTYQIFFGLTTMFILIISCQR